MLKFKKSVIFILILSVTLGVFSSCDLGKSAKNKYTSYSFDYFDTVTTVIGYEESEAEFNKNTELVMSTLERYHKLFDIYNTYSGLNNLKTVNALHDGAHIEVKVDESIIELIEISRDLYEKTDGNFNIAMGSVLSIWHQYRTAGEMNPDKAKLPSLEKLHEAKEHIDFSCIKIDKERSTVFITDPEATIDVGAIGKGYATEMAARELEKAGVNGYILNVGGNVRTVGDKPDGKWVMGIQNPDTESQEPYVKRVSFSDMSLVTSGSYQRFYEVDGVSYHHIIDKDTLFPAEHFVSVSVIYPDSGIADALSTSLFCMSYEEGLELLGKFDGAEAMWITKEGKYFYSENFDKYVKAGER